MMTIDQFRNALSKGIAKLVNDYGNCDAKMVFLLNLDGGRKYDTIVNVADRIFLNDSLCPQAIDIGLTNIKEANEVYIVVSAHEYVPFSNFSEEEYGIPLNIMGRQEY